MTQQQVAKLPRVIWDMTFTVRSITGTRMYTHTLYQSTAATPEWDLRELYGNTEVGRERRGNLRSNIRNVLWLWSGLEHSLRRAQPDLFHAAAYLGPRRAPCPMIVNVFDTSYITYPQYFDWKWRLYAQTVIPATVKRAAAILTLSEHARGEIVKSYQVPYERVHIVPPGIGKEFQAEITPDTIEAVRTKYGLGANYLIFVGAPHPRKNLPALVQAFALARREMPDLELALVGPRRKEPPLDQAIRESGVAAAIHQLDYVPQQDLPPLYAGACAFVFASKLEGFGIPPVEAMASGIPVISVPNPPMPEVLGEAAWFTENDSPEALAAGISHVLNDASLRDAMRARGIERARLYSWEHSARKTWSVYEDVLAEHRRK